MGEAIDGITIERINRRNRHTLLGEVIGLPALHMDRGTVTLEVASVNHGQRIEVAIGPAVVRAIARLSELTGDSQ